MRDDVLSLKEDTSVLTAIVLRLERDAARREAFCREMSERLSLRVEPADSAEADSASSYPAPA